jgi:hypothetical protein
MFPIHLAFPKKGNHSSDAVQFSVKWSMRQEHEEVHSTLVAAHDSNASRTFTNSQAIAGIS